MNKPMRLTTVRIQQETDVVACRQSAKQIAAWLGFAAIDQIRIATAVSELARNIYQYVGEGAFHFDLGIGDGGRVDRLQFEAVDSGAGIVEIDRILNGTYVSPTGMGIGLAGAQRLMDEFAIDTGTSGTCIRAAKFLYPERDLPDHRARALMRGGLPSAENADPYIELQVRGTELLLATSELQEKQLELEATNLELENTNKGVVALYSELEKAAQATRELAESKSRFFSNMTHEFRTPINIIDNVSKLLLSGVDGALMPEQRKQMEFISMAAAELSELVEELLALAEADSGRMEIAPAAFTLSEFMGQVRQFTGALAMRYPDVTWSIAPLPAGVELDTDQTRLFQILRNLISNAFKYTPRGHVKIQVFEPDAHALEFMVEDSGIGISAVDQARIFEEFARLRNPAMANVQGNGLGLPLAQRLATLLKGEITLTSTPGRGSRFYARIAREYAGGSADLATLNLHGITVLIIDDSEPDRYLLSRILQPYGPVIIEAATAAASIDALHAVRPDIIFLDLDLPDISGADLLETMDWSIHSRVIVNTAKSLGDGERSQLAGRCRGIVNKAQPDYTESVLRLTQLLAGEYGIAH